MAKLTPQERLQPALLDRLRDDHPRSQQEPPDARVMTVRQLHDSVVRDLEWLLNSHGIESTIDAKAYPETMRSVINYGIADLSGRTISGTDASVIEREIREAIERFEPRILPESLKVRVSTGDGVGGFNRLAFEIRGDLWATPIPLEFLLLTEVDLEAGNVTISEG